MAIPVRAAEFVALALLHVIAVLAFPALWCFWLQNRLSSLADHLRRSPYYRVEAGVWIRETWFGERRHADRD